MFLPVELLSYTAPECFRILQGLLVKPRILFLGRDVRPALDLFGRIIQLLFVHLRHMLRIFHVECLSCKGSQSTNRRIGDSTTADKDYPVTEVRRGGSKWK